MSSSERHLPPIENVRRLHIFRNGDSSFPGKRVNFNKKQIPSFDTFLTELTKAINPRFGAVRQLYTPHGTRKVMNFDDLDRCGLSFVAAGKEKFVRMDYLSIDDHLNTRRKPPAPRKEIIPVKHSRIIASGRIKKVHNTPVVIFVHSNGNDLDNPHRIRLAPRQQVDWECILNSIAESVKLRYGGAIRRLYTTDGHEVRDIQELDNYGVYVAVDKFNKFIHCSYPGSKSSPFASSSITSSPRNEARRNYPYGLKLTPLRSDKKHSSVELSGSSTSSQLSPQVNSKKSRFVLENNTFSQSNESRSKPPNMKNFKFDNDRENQYKAKSTNRHTYGAQEIPESRFTKVEYPIDQRKAEEIQLERIEHYTNSERKQNNKMDEAATKIQANYRGYLDRKSLKKSQKRKEVGTLGPYKLGVKEQKNASIHSEKKESDHRYDVSYSYDRKKGKNNAQFSKDDKVSSSNDLATKTQDFIQTTYKKRYVRQTPSETVKRVDVPDIRIETAGQKDTANKVRWIDYAEGDKKGNEKKVQSHSEAFPNKHHEYYGSKKETRVVKQTNKNDKIDEQKLPVKSMSGNFINDDVVGDWQEPQHYGGQYQDPLDTSDSDHINHKTNNDKHQPLSLKEKQEYSFTSKQYSGQINNATIPAVSLNKYSEEYWNNRKHSLETDYATQDANIGNDLQLKTDAHLYRNSDQENYWINKPVHGIQPNGNFNSKNLEHKGSKSEKRAIANVSTNRFQKANAGAYEIFDVDTDGTPDVHDHLSNEQNKTSQVHPDMRLAQLEQPLNTYKDIKNNVKQNLTTFENYGNGLIDSGYTKATSDVRYAATEVADSVPSTLKHIPRNNRRLSSELAEYSDEHYNSEPASSIQKLSSTFQPKRISESFDF